ncbi:hypothetical protein [Pseudonocardia humida]|uniref:Uncharacterized protein n=1 Tax=Pseudonocardia humida TaxID=2800819 RepID=A0ABT0ZT39_9PSEU|nr:hypothetical protein [Pseudonocardia humida]MCO1653901.1 hypothetical protein [Pseudonocardia humida]
MARADPGVAAQIAREHGCRSAEDDMVTTIETVVRRVDSDASALLDAEAIMRQVPARDLGENLGRECGRELIDAAYSSILVRIQDLDPTTVYGRVAHNAVLTGLCGDDVSRFELDAQARVVCAGR